MNLQDKYGRTSLMYASRNTRCIGSENEVEILLQNNADVNIQDMNGWTALMHAIETKIYSTDRTVKLLLDYNANVNLVNNDGDNALILCLRNFEETTNETIKMILEKTDSVDLEINGKKLIKFIWDESFPDEIIEAFIRKGANPSDVFNERDKNFIQKYLC